MLLQPKWYKELPTTVKPLDVDVIQKVRIWKQKNFFDDNAITMAIMTSRWAVRRIQYSILTKVKTEMKNASEREQWKAVLMSRLQVKLSTAEFEMDPQASPLSKSKIMGVIKNVDGIIGKMGNFDEVVDYIEAMDEEENRFHDVTGLQEELEEILANIASEENRENEIDANSVNKHDQEDLIVEVIGNSIFRRAKIELENILKDKSSPFFALHPNKLFFDLLILNFYLAQREFQLYFEDLEDPLATRILDKVILRTHKSLDSTSGVFRIGDIVKDAKEIAILTRNLPPCENVDIPDIKTRLSVILEYVLPNRLFDYGSCQKQGTLADMTGILRHGEDSCITRFFWRHVFSSDHRNDMTALMFQMSTVSLLLLFYSEVFISLKKQISSSGPTSFSKRQDTLVKMKSHSQESGLETQSKNQKKYKGDSERAYAVVFIFFVISIIIFSILLKLGVIQS